MSLSRGTLNVASSTESKRLLTLERYPSAQVLRERERDFLHLEKKSEHGSALPVQFSFTAREEKKTFSHFLPRINVGYAGLFLSHPV